MSEDIVIESEVEARVGHVHAEEHAQQLIEYQQGQHGPEQAPCITLHGGHLVHRRVKTAQIGLVGMAEHDAVAAAVAIGHQLALLHVGDGLDNAAPLLGAVAVGAGKTSRQAAVSVFLEFSREHLHVLPLEPRLHPVAQAGRHDEH